MRVERCREENRPQAESAETGRFGGSWEPVGKGETADKGEDLAGRVDRPV
jgi:hypothetical protein